MIVASERIQDIKSELMELLLAHKEEVSLFGADIPLDPDWDTYQILEDRGVLSLFTARIDSRIIGYYAAFITRHLHYNIKIATNDVLYMVPNYRGKALKFFRIVETCLKTEGVQYITFNMKPHVDFSKFAEYMGFPSQNFLN